MKPCKGQVSSKILILPYPKDKSSNSLRKIILYNFDDFFAYISLVGLKVEHKEQIQNVYNTSITKLTLPTTCFKVDFNDSFVTIIAIKNM